MERVIFASIAIVAVFLAAAFLHRKTLVARFDAALDRHRKRKASRQAPQGGPDDWRVEVVQQSRTGVVLLRVLGTSGEPDPDQAASLAAYITSTGIVARYLDPQQLAQVIREVSP